ncbi:MAG: hypothetical protein IIZ47_02375 [Erysipelotrichaceae bacterium]|nr:hypothetical protein [Erysipelotrichaceae bacterium]
MEFREHLTAAAEDGYDLTSDSFLKGQGMQYRKCFIVVKFMTETHHAGIKRFVRGKLVFHIFQSRGKRSTPAECLLDINSRAQEGALDRIPVRNRGAERLHEHFVLGAKSGGPSSVEYPDTGNKRKESKRDRQQEPETELR